MLEASQDICKLLNADRLTLYAVNDDRTAIVSKIKTGLNSSRDLKLPIRRKALPAMWRSASSTQHAPMSMTTMRSSASTRRSPS
jgi:hypothetical protein